MTSQDQPLLGCTVPRLFTPALTSLEEGTSDGPAFIKWWRETLCVPMPDGTLAFGEPLPWQEWLANHLLELNPDGTYRHRVALILVARQNGKTAFLVALALWRMHVKGHLVLGAAQNLDTAREALLRAQYLTEDVPILDVNTSKILTANGKESILLRNRASWIIAAANRRAGRGKTIDFLLLDELREQTDWDAWSALSKTTTARPNAQIVAISNAGEHDSEVLNDLRAKALGGLENAPALFEWSAEEGCDLDDPAGWQQANPSLGYIFDESAIRSALATDPPTKFRIEVLCQRVDVLDSAVDPDAWKACADPAGTLDSSRERVALCLDIAPDLGHATLVAAAVQSDGRTRIEVVTAWSGNSCTSEVRAQLPELLARIKPRAIGWYPQGPAAPLATDLKLVKGVRELKPADAVTACQELAEQAVARQILHPSDPLLDAHILTARKQPTGDGWRFTRKEGHVDAAYAAAGALHLARTMPRPAGKPRIILPRNVA